MPIIVIKEKIMTEKVMHLLPRQEEYEMELPNRIIAASKKNNFLISERKDFDNQLLGN